MVHPKEVALLLDDTQSAQRADPHASDPSRNGKPDRLTTADLNTIRAALAKVGSKRTDDDWCRQVVKQARR